VLPEFSGKGDRYGSFLRATDPLRISSRAFPKLWESASRELPVLCRKRASLSPDFLLPYSPVCSSLTKPSRKGFPITTPDSVFPENEFRRPPAKGFPVRGRRDPGAGASGAGSSGIRAYRREKPPSGISGVFGISLSGDGIRDKVSRELSVITVLSEGDGTVPDTGFRLSPEDPVISPAPAFLCPLSPSMA
jgi:hypothetical protein